ncbi:MAG: ABC transporter permease [Candidatus Spechtbacterales bacterium]
MIVQYILFAVAAWLVGLFIRSEKRNRKFIVKRVAWAVIIIVAVSIPYHYIVTTAPGDPVDIIAGQYASEEVKEDLREELGFNDPYLVRYSRFMTGFVTGDWGESYRLRDQSARELFDERALVSAPLGIASAAIVIIFGVPWGLFTAWKQGSWIDNLFFVGGQIFIIIPSLIVIQIYILLLSIKLNLLPAGWQGGWEGIFTLSAIIPILVLAVPGIFGMAHFVRSAALQSVRHSSVTAAKAKGMSTPQILKKVVLPDIRGPLIIALTPVMFTFFEGSFFVEMIYGIPGLAVFLLDSLFGRDYPIILNIGFLGVCLGIFSKIIEDILQHTDRRVDTT